MVASLPFAGADSTWLTVAAALGPAVALVGIAVSLAVNAVTIRQKQQSDAAAQRAAGRAEWWRRSQWAMDRAVSADPQQRELGTAFARALMKSELAAPEDLEHMELLFTPRVDDLGPGADTGSVDAEFADGSEGGQR